MTGDRHKSMPRLIRWIETFGDGMYRTTRKNKRQIPSLVIDKRQERRRRRHDEEQESPA
jgi:hypothetical protein